MNDEFNGIASAFPEPFRLLVRETAESTNDEARILGQAGASAGLVLLARQQTAGRGRRGAAWFSPGGESLAFSILIRPDEPKALWPRLALATGLAVAEAMESFGLNSGIKWPNDVWLRGRKVAGILVEAGSDFAVVGIGLNVNTRVFPEEIAHIATSIGLESGEEIPRPEVLGAVIRRFAACCPRIGADFEELLESVRQRCVLTGHGVSLSTPNGPLQGIVEGISPSGALLLRTQGGLESLIQADEVRILD